MKRLVLFAVAAFLVLICVVTAYRTATFDSIQPVAESYTPLPIDGAAAVEHLAGALRCKTVSNRDREAYPVAEFKKLHRHLETAFPLVHKRLERQLIDELGLLYTWQGEDTAKKPAIFIGHIDVVPATENLDAWTRAPFSGAVYNGFIWGRGALDDKGCVLAILEAVEGLLASGFEPERTIYLAFGHDEELGGPRGARATAAMLKEKGVSAAYSLDEGLVITDGIVPGMSGPLALVATAEKGYVTIELSVETEGGHSSQPPAETTIGILARAITRLETSPMPAELKGPVKRMFEYAGPEMDLPMKVVLANLWLFGPVVKGQLQKGAATNAGLRTTIAPTIIHAGVKENVLPATGRAVINFRLMPGDTSDAVLAHVRETVGDPRVKLKFLGEPRPPSPVSDDRNAFFGAIAKSVRQVWPEAAVAPSLQIGGTDSKHYTEISQNLYRFTPFWFREHDLTMFHGVNEKVAVERYLEAIQFYGLVIQNTQ